MRYRGILAVISLSLLLPLPARAQHKTADEVLPARRVTLAKGLTVAAALKQISEQTKITVKDLRSAPIDAKLQAALANVTFWQALDAIAGEVGAGLSLYRGDGSVALVDGKPPRVAPGHHGIFRTAVKRLNMSRDFESDGHQCQVRLELAWEPWFKPFFVEVKSYQATYAADAAGKELSATGKVGRNTLVDKEAPRHAYEIDWRMPAPPRSAPALKSLTGEMHVIGPEKMLTFTFDDLKKAQTQKVDSITVRLSKFFVKGPSYWSLQIDLDYPPTSFELESFQSQSWLAHNRIWLQDRKDARRMIAAQPYWVASRVTSNQATITYFFKDEPKGAKTALKLGKAEDWQLVYVTPGRIVELHVPFAFQNVPLP